jgi:hypothetical protein
MEPILYSYGDIWKRLFPTYTVKLWSEKDYLPLIERFSPLLLKAYHLAPSYASKSDIARYIILYYEGGLYSDTDIEPFRNHEYLINDESIALCIVCMNLSKSKIFFGNFRYSTAWIYARKGCSYLEVFLNRIANTPYKGGSKFDYALTVTGPKGMSVLAEDLGLTEKEDVRIYDHSMIEVASFANVAITTMSREQILKEYPYAISLHRMRGSWIDNVSIYKQFGRIYTFYNDWPDFIILGFIASTLFFAVMYFTA